jgi:hypothetical protein
MELGKISKDNLSKVKLNGFKIEKRGTLNVNSLGTVELIHGSLIVLFADFYRNSNFIFDNILHNIIAPLKNQENYSFYRT